MTEVSLDRVIEVIELSSDESTAYVHEETGEVFVIEDSDWEILESGVVPPDLPAWHREMLEPLLQLDRRRLTELPDSFDLNEWKILDRFAQSRSNQRQREALSQAIRGRGAFRLFEREVEYFGLRDEWYAYRSEAIAKFARDWLEEHGFSIIETPATNP